MPKQKTKKAVVKRFKKRKSGSLERGHAKTSHLFANKSQKNKRQARKSTDVSKADTKRYKHVIK